MLRRKPEAGKCPNSEVHASLIDDDLTNSFNRLPISITRAGAEDYQSRSGTPDRLESSCDPHSYEMQFRYYRHLFAELLIRHGK